MSYDARKYESNSVGNSDEYHAEMIILARSIFHNDSGFVVYIFASGGMMR